MFQFQREDSPFCISGLQFNQEAWAERVICLFLLLHHPLSSKNTHSDTHTLPACAVARAGIMSLWHSKRRLGPIWWGLLDKSWIWLQMSHSPISQAPCNRVLDLFPPLAEIWRFATQTREWEEAFALIHHSKSIGCRGECVLSFHPGWAHCCLLCILFARSLVFY